MLSPIAALALCALLVASHARAPVAVAQDAVIASAEETASAREDDSVLASAQDTAAPRAQDVDYATGRKAAQADLVKRLESLAEWCNSKELFQERDRVWRTILGLDTDNAAARKALRYARNPDGSWKEPAPREAKDRNPKALEELPAKRSAATEPYRDALMKLVANEPESSPLRRATYEEILALDPDDALIHTLRGEKAVDGKWMLHETARAKKRRAEIKEIAKASLATDAKIEKLEPDALEQNLGLHWSSAFRSESVRVLSTGDEAEARQTAALVHAAGAFFRAIFACETQHRDSWTSYLLVHPGEQDTFLDHAPGLTADYRAFLKQVVGCGIPGQPKIVYWDKDPAHRLDGCTRQTINDFLGRTFGLTMDHGWAWEGFGLYLNRELTGTRFTWFIQPSSDGKYNALRARLMSPNANWMNEALTMLSAADHPKLAVVLGTDVNKMGVAEMLYAYVFAAYLIEGRPDDAPELLRAIGSMQQPADQALQSVLHTSAAELDDRVQRWLSERK